MKYDIYICNLDRSQTFHLPIIPENMPELQRSSKNEVFETFSDGDYNLIGAVGLAEFTLESWLPGKKKEYYFQRSMDFQADSFIFFLETERLYKRPIRIIFAREDGTFPVNDTFSIESLDWNENRRSDYVYRLKCKQWREIK